MNRLVRSMLALAVGFVGATAVFAAVARDSNSTGDPEVIGTVDVFDACRVLYGEESSAVLTVSNAYGWRCTDRPNGIFQLLDVDFGEACRSLFDDAAQPALTDESDPYAWVCTTPD